ncbi:MAG: GTP cyclohydrolase FolE2 [Spirochaetes bacterium]|nr:GTP cyclohydrolase FolE2 [Spirochaetota bacterium]
MILPDIHNNPAENKIPINKVGVKGFKFPIKVYDKLNKYQHSIGNITLLVDLPSHFKGTHMSRFIEILNEEGHDEISVDHLKKLLSKIKDKLNAKVSYIEIEFPYFIKKESPISKIKALLNYEVKLIAKYGEEFDYEMVVNVPVHILCPCSKIISEFSAHNQRANVTVSYKAKKVIWIEDIIQVVENSASCEIYPILKRNDEKYVTEKAYKNPKFVEDIVREISIKLDNFHDIFYYKVEVQSIESIHNHDAYACIEKEKKIP